MGILIKLLLLYGLIMLLRETEKPFMCAGIYMAVILIWNFFMGASIGDMFFYALIAGALAALYFWLLDRFMGTGWIFWTIALAGVIIGLV